MPKNTSNLGILGVYAGADVNSLVILASLFCFLAWVVCYCILCESHTSRSVWLKELSLRICYEKDRVNMTWLTRLYHQGYVQAIRVYHHYQLIRYFNWNHR